ncbi:Imm3 family immunity protein [Bacillus sp. DX4.1]|uniref:Imm3 family immunity protein n=1 Tax=Bacillus sp. DX4.1 TaxID=3055867 RepID=UPI0025A1DFCD|nr:Imm3 family immunity protein [Bacillus sp. DX4.1]MDM5186405.1 Imm3 family immunity protein [Bacillus sp. DX4.1]
MENWEYNELFEDIKEAYNDFLILNRGYRYAIARAADEYINLGKIEDVIADTAVGEILLTHDKVFIGYIKGITKRLSKFNPLDAVGELTQEEIRDLSNRIHKVLEGLEKVEIDYNPSAE